MKFDLEAYLNGRIQRLEGMQSRARIMEARFVWIRLTVLLVGLGLIAGAHSLGLGQWTWGVTIFASAIFILVVMAHRKVFDLLERETLMKDMAVKQLARLQLDWKKLPQVVFALGEDSSPLERDLDLLGERSLHRLLDLSVTREGSQRLREWFSNPAANLADVLPSRQDLVRELIPLTGFRERMALSSSLVFGPKQDRFDGQGLRQWLEKRIVLASLGRPLIVLGGLSIVNIILFVANAAGWLPPYWALSLLVYGGIYFYIYGTFKNLFNQAATLQNRLSQFGEIAKFLETYRYKSGGKLAELCKPFTDPQECPSRYLKGIARVTNAAGLQANAALWLTLNILVPWDLYFAYRLEQYKTALRDRLPIWLDVWYELEALTSLANFAFLHPGYVFPQIRWNTDGKEPVFRANQLGHPLIPESVRVCNSFHLDQPGDLALITGSNMSGKSTFLRTLGINLCLAYAGAPVAADQFLALPFRLYTCIQVTDSLADGISYFYAEVRRLRGLLDALADQDQRPVFYLIDEIFRGTNNREREAGSRAFVRALAGSPGVGLISTHDLELAHLSAEIPAVKLYHFRERVTDERLVFEYHLRSGPSETTNALMIMRQEGLPVP